MKWATTLAIARCHRSLLCATTASRRATLPVTAQWRRRSSAKTSAHATRATCLVTLHGTAHVTVAALADAADLPHAADLAELEAEGEFATIATTQDTLRATARKAPAHSVNRAHATTATSLATLLATAQSHRSSTSRSAFYHLFPSPFQ